MAGYPGGCEVATRSPAGAVVYTDWTFCTRKPHPEALQAISTAVSTL